VPFFLGMALGDLTVGSLWSLIGVFMEKPSINLFPDRRNGFINAIIFSVARR